MDTEEMVKICKEEYEKGKEFTEYINKIRGPGGQFRDTELEELFKHIIIYDICIYYRKGENKWKQFI